MIGLVPAFSGVWDACALGRYSGRSSAALPVVSERLCEHALYSPVQSGGAAYTVRDGLASCAGVG